jgi:small GTP-binding protein
LSISKIDYAFKICVFGEQLVGKTTLINYYFTKHFDIDTKPTLGASIYVKSIEINNKNINFQIWDFGGEERFRELLQNYSPGASGGIFMIDSTNLNTVNNISEWISIFRSSANTNFGNTPILMVCGNKDLEAQKVFTKDDIMKYKEQFEIFDIIETSSKSGENVEYVFEVLIRKIVELNIKNPI